MRLTVLIPVNNTPAHHLLEAVRCITEQDDGNDHRIILIDDASFRKDTLWALEMLSQDHEVLRMKWNSGISGALNAGHKLVDTEYVAHMDADDICSRNRFSVMLEALEQDPEIDVLGCQLFSFWDDDITRSRLYTSQHPQYPTIIERGERAWLVNHATILIRQSAFMESGGYATELWRAQDVDLWGRMYHQGFKFSNVPQCLYGWRRYRADLESSSPSSAPSQPVQQNHSEHEISETESQLQPADPDTADADA